MKIKNFKITLILYSTMISQQSTFEMIVTFQLTPIAALNKWFCHLVIRTAINLNQISFKMIDKLCY